MSKKRTFGTNLVEIENKEQNLKSHVVRSAFDNVWSKRGWTLVETEGSKEGEKDEAPQTEGNVTGLVQPVESPKADESARLAALKTAPKKEQG